VRQVLPVILLGASLAVLGGCVPTTKYTYVPLTQQNFEAAQNGDRIPLVAEDTALCFADGRTEFVRDAVWTDEGICGNEAGMTGDAYRECFGWDAIAGVGIPYEGRSMSAVPMAAVQIGECDPEALSE
jgi:hypothetical protein